MTARVCALAGCGLPVPPPARAYCSPEHRAEAAAQRRSARRRDASDAARRERQDALVDAMEHLGILTAAARTAGVDPRTAYRWADADPEFARRLEAARRIAWDGHEAHLLAVARSGDPDPVSLRAAEAVCRRTDRLDARRRGGEAAAARRAAPPPPEPDCDAALDWARRGRLAAV